MAQQEAVYATDEVIRISQIIPYLVLNYSSMADRSLSSGTREEKQELMV